MGRLVPAEAETMKTIVELLDLTGKSAIVTGGAEGIGSGICYRLAEAGASVVVVDIDFTAAEVTSQLLRQNGWTACAYKADVASEAESRAMVEFCRNEYGSVDILVNNAGIDSMVLATKYAGEVMKRQDNGGKIINITSIDAVHPSILGLAHYDASKPGAKGFTKNAALELAPHHITVNAVMPDGVRTSDTDEVGTAALFFASDLASYITGAQLVVDGGALLR
jgi:2-dehydro-3-deoxy-D-gluconate 5-dehydrogenase